MLIIETDYIVENIYLKKRLRAILDLFKIIKNGSDPLSNTSKGEERELFLNSFLSEILPTRARIKRGEITDLHGNRSGQLDCVVEYGFFPSLPLIPSTDTRLFIAESVAVVIEIKSDLSKQWKQIRSTAKSLSIVKRRLLNSQVTNERIPTGDIPFIVVGYNGWQNDSTLRTRMENCPGLHGVLDLKHEILIAKIPFRKKDGTTWVFDYGANGEDALWGLACILSEQINSLLLTEALASDYTFLKD